MKIEKVIIEDKIKRKILSKHNVTAYEIKKILLSKPIFLKAKKGRYLAIGKFKHRYLTIVFEYKNKQANVVTSYPSSEWQINLYKDKKKR